MSRTNRIVAGKNNFESGEINILRRDSSTTTVCNIFFAPRKIFTRYNFVWFRMTISGTCPSILIGTIQIDPCPFYYKAQCMYTVARAERNINVKIVFSAGCKFPINFESRDKTEQCYFVIGKKQNNFIYSEHDNH